MGHLGWEHISLPVVEAVPEHMAEQVLVEMGLMVGQVVVQADSIPLLLSAVLVLLV